MAVRSGIRLFNPLQAADGSRANLRKKLAQFPWWAVALALAAVGVLFSIVIRPTFAQAFGFITAGLGVTLATAFTAYAIAMVLGLMAGLGRVSLNVAARNIATLYVEVVRGVPMLVLIFFIALVGVPALVDALRALGAGADRLGFGEIGGWLQNLDSKSLSMGARAVTALSITYGAFLAEIFRGGIQSVGTGQMEAARSQGMTYAQAMRYIILPQAVRNILPAIGNEFISMLKDTSLVSVLAVRDVTQVARLYAGQSFRYAEAYTVLAVLYLVMTMGLSFLMKWIERRYRIDGRK